MSGVAFIGVGQMGGAMASHLTKVEGGLRVCDPNPAATGPLVEAGATLATTPAEAACDVGLVSLMVLDDAQVEQVVFGENGVLSSARPDTIIAIHSTIAAGTAESVAARCRDVGVHVVDAPVSGGFMGAHAGTLATMVGGTQDAVATCRPIFEHWADLIVHFGPIGAGTKAKLARNLMHFVAFTAASEAQRLAEAAGIDLRQLARVVRHTDAITGGPGSIMLRDTTADLQPEDDWFDILMHVRTLGEKDLSLALDLAHSLGVDLPLAEVARLRFGPGLGLPHHNHSDADNHSDEDNEDTP